MAWIASSNMISSYADGASVAYSGLFFFFQAEDGIRDYKVTGVQTCALPICGDCSPGDECAPDCNHHHEHHHDHVHDESIKSVGIEVEGELRANKVNEWFADQIGRASCRERV